jgi:hypothetical protein
MLAQLLDLKVSKAFKAQLARKVCKDLKVNKAFKAQLARKVCKELKVNRAFKAFQELLL